jgi:hypothetical protein
MIARSVRIGDPNRINLDLNTIAASISGGVNNENIWKFEGRLLSSDGF